MKKTFMKLTSALFIAVLALISANVQAGCNDPLACNFNAADTDALDCVFEGFTLTVGGSSFDAEIGWQLFDSGGGLVDEGIAYAGGSPFINTYCLPDDCYDFVMTDAFGDGWNGGSATFTSYDGATTYLTTSLANNGPTFGTGPETTNVGIGAAACVIAGCVDPGACNFTAGNNQDDGSCEYLTCAGCTNDAFCEYDPLATIDDGSCLTVVGCFDPLSCLFDINAACGDQVVLCAQAANDTCNGAVDLGTLAAGVTTFNVDNTSTCVDVAVGEAAGVWYSFTTPAAGDFEVSFETVDDLSGNVYDTNLAIFDDCTLLTQLSFDDDGGAGLLSLLSFACGDLTLANATTYLLMVDGFSGQQGTVDVVMTVDTDICVTGCTNPLALNYDGPTFVIDDGSCVVPDCVDPALNVVYCYDSNENTGLLYLENDPLEGVAVLFNAGQIENDIFDVINIYSGIDATGTLLFSNVGTGATLDLTGVAVESTPGDGGLFIELITDGVVSCFAGNFPAMDFDVYCGTAAFPGCMDPLALNFDPAATVDDGSCIIPDCPDPAVNYTYCYGENEAFGQGFLGTVGEVVVVFNAGQIENPIFDVITIYDGADNTGAILYTNAADGGTTDLTGVTVESTTGAIFIELTTDASVSCQSGAFIAWDYDVYCATEIIYGCQDPAACNFDATADIDDGSCCLDNCVNINLSGGLNDGDLFWFLEQSDGTNVFGAGIAQGAPYDALSCLTDDCYTLRILSAVGAGWPAGTITITDFGGAVIYTSDFASGEGDGGYLSLHLFSVGAVPCATCQDTNACNFDASGVYADCDACEYVSCAGCTYAFASNFDPAASYDDGTCLPPALCPGDADGNNAVNVLDLVAVSSNFGSTCP